MLLEKAWKQFALSGKIEDYLSYKQLKDLKDYDKEQNSIDSKCVSNKRNEYR